MSSNLEKIELGPLFDQKGNIRYTSVSQLQTAERCPRRWYYEKVERNKPPPTKAQAIGTALHDEWHAHFMHGEALGPLAMAGIEHIPDGQFTSEQPIMWYDAEGFLQAYVYVDGTPLVGYLDILQPYRVRDIKTTSDAKWAKTPDQLGSDLQMLGYGLATWEIFGHRDPIDLEHWYFQTRGKPKSWVVGTTATPTQAISAWAKTTPIMQTIRMAAALGPGCADQVPGNPDACGDFRGCYQSDRCSIGASHLLATMFAADEAPTTHKPKKELEADMSTPFFTPPAAPAGMSPEAQASLAKFRGGASDTQALEAAQVGFLVDLIRTADYGTPPLTGALAFALCRHRGIAETPTIPGTKAMQVLENPIETIEDLKALADQVGKGPQLVDMPTFVARAANPGSPQAPAQHVAATPVALPFAPQHAQMPFPTETIVPPDAPDPSEKKRGRPKLGKGKAAAEPAYAFQPHETPAAQEMPLLRDPVTQGHAADPGQQLPASNGRSFIVASVDPSRIDHEAAARAYPQGYAGQEHAPPPPAAMPELAAPKVPVTHAAPKVRATAPGFTLYIDCLPAAGEQPQPLYEYVNEAMGALAKMAKVDDVRLVDKNSPLAYGAWRAALQALVIKQPPPDGVWFLDTRGSEPNEVVAMALITKANQVTRGLR